MKKILCTLLFAPFFFISSCEEEGPIHGCLDSQALNYTSEASIDDNSCEYPEIGSIYQGGIVFYIDETGEHGLIAALEDLTEGATDPGGWGINGYEWGCNGVFVDGADGIEIGTGYQNTLDIVNQGCTTTGYGGVTAAQAALDAEINDYSDWYLPSKDELEEMYNTIGNGGPEGNIGGFMIEYPYWSSSEHNDDNSRVLNFSSGIMNFDYKGFAYSVRVIRSF